MTSLTSSKEITCAENRINWIVTGSDISCTFHYVSHHECPALDGSPAFVIYLYQRNLLVTGRALASDWLDFPDSGQIVHIEGKVIRCDGEIVIWVRKLKPLDVLGPDQFIFDLALPQWVIDHSVVDRAKSLWASIPDEDRVFVNSVFHEPQVMQGFLAAPGSCKHHHAHAGGCLLHSVEIAEMASFICESQPHLDRSLLVSSALTHDAGKSIEYAKTRGGLWKMSLFGRRVGHKIGGIQLATIAIGRCRTMASKRKIDYLHMFASSYAPSWAGFRPPDSAEAALLSALDRAGAEAAPYRGNLRIQPV